MATSFDTEITNSNISSTQYYIDDDGSFKFLSPYLSSANFDGSIATIEESTSASALKPGWLIKIGSTYLPIISVSYDNAILEGTPSSNIITIVYMDANNSPATIQYNFADSVDVRYEDWGNKYIGSQGWMITSGGNAIFANVGVRGRIEATEGEFSGNLLVSGSISTADGVGGVGIPGIILTDNGFFAYNSSGTQTFSINADTGAVTIGSVAADQLATDAELSSGLGGKINNGNAASDIVTYQTTITGGNISTGKIKSGGYSGPGTGSAFSTVGMLINLDDGGIASKNFRIDPSGNAFFNGDITAKSGYFGNSTYGMSIIDDGSTVSIKSTTLRIGSQLSSGILHGSINFYTVGGSAIGSINSAASDKNWSSLGDGIILGTSLDYLFIPSANNTTVTRSRFRGSALDFYNTSNLFRIRLNNSGLNIGSDAVINFFDTAENVGAYIDYAAASDTLLIDNGGAAGGVVNVRASDLQLNGVSVAGGGGGGSYTLTNTDIINLPAVPNNANGAKVLYGSILASVPGDATNYPANSIVIIT